MKTTQVLFTWLLPALSLLLASSQVLAMALLQSDVAESADHNSNLATLGEINAVFNISYQDLALRWKIQADKDLGDELEESYLWNFDPSVNTSINHSVLRVAADCFHCIAIFNHAEGVFAEYLHDLGSWHGTQQIAPNGLRSDKENDIASLANWNGLTRTTEPGALVLMSLGILGLVFSGKRKGV
ncbi:MAG: hypothetical protein P8103_04580 [Candidatus Thiodiazotropha sp.]